MASIFDSPANGFGVSSGNIPDWQQKVNSNGLYGSWTPYVDTSQSYLGVNDQSYKVSDQFQPTDWNAQQFNLGGLTGITGNNNFEFSNNLGSQQDAWGNTMAMNDGQAGWRYTGGPGNANGVSNTYSPFTSYGVNTGDWQQGSNPTLGLKLPDGYWGLGDYYNAWKQNPNSDWGKIFQGLVNNNEVQYLDNGGLAMYDPGGLRRTQLLGGVGYYSDPGNSILKGAPGFTFMASALAGGSLASALGAAGGAAAEAGSFGGQALGDISGQLGNTLGSFAGDFGSFTNPFGAVTSGLSSGMDLAADTPNFNNYLGLGDTASSSLPNSYWNTFADAGNTGGTVSDTSPIQSAFDSLGGSNPTGTGYEGLNYGPDWMNQPGAGGYIDSSTVVPSSQTGGLTQAGGTLQKLADAGISPQLLQQVGSYFMPNGDFNMGSLFGQGAKSLLNYFVQNQLANKYNQIAQNASAMSNPLMQPQRAPYQSMAYDLLNNPQNYFQNNPFASTLAAQFKNNIIPTQVAKSGNPASVLDQAGSQFANAIAGNYNNLAEILGMYGGFNQGPGYTGLAYSQNAGLGAQANALGYRGLGEMFGNMAGNSQAGQVAQTIANLFGTGSRYLFG